jgi:hypothetical protein
MNRLSTTLLGLLCAGSGLFAQSKSADTVRVLLIVDKNPFPGANYVIKGTTTGTVSDVNGVATLIVPADKDKVAVSIIGPYIELSILRPVDSIYFDLNSQKATYYFQRKQIRRRKQLVTGY